MSVQEVDYIWMDGEIVDWVEAKTHVMTHCLHYGTGVFEGIRAYKSESNLHVFRFKEHLDRLFESAKLYFMKPEWSKEELEEATIELIRRNELMDDCYIRPLIYRGYGSIGVNPLETPVRASIIAIPFGKYIEAEGAECCTSSWRRIPGDILPPESKACGNYINSVLAKVEAVKNGFDEAIFLDDKGYVSEGSGENIFILKDDALITPSVYSSILIGITRDTVMKLADDMGLKVVERPVTRFELYNCDEAFFCGTAAEITPIIRVDHHNIGDGTIGPMVEELASKFDDIVRGINKDYENWLTPIY
ncbi:MAG: branched-chain amino acid transaminase [Candidatus Bathyarchaeia archaeon]